MITRSILIESSIHYSKVEETHLLHKVIKQKLCINKDIAEIRYQISIKVHQIY